MGTPRAEIEAAVRAGLLFSWRTAQGRACDSRLGPSVTRPSPGASDASTTGECSTCARCSEPSAETMTMSRPVACSHSRSSSGSPFITADHDGRSRGDVLELALERLATRSRLRVVEPPGFGSSLPPAIHPLRAARSRSPRTGARDAGGAHWQPQNPSARAASGWTSTRSLPCRRHLRGG